MNLKQVRKGIKEQLPGLISAIQSGDIEAQEEFSKLLLPYLKAVLYRYRATIDDDVESLAGFIITKLINGIHDIDMGRSPMSYIDTITNNQAIDQHRKYTRNKANNTVEYVANTPYDSMEELSGYSGGVRSARELIYDTLDPMSADFFSMHCIDNVPVREIADMSGVSPSEINKIIAHAKENLKRAVI